MYGILDGLLGALPHAHDALDVVLLVLTAHSHPQQQLQQPAHLHRVTVFTCNPLSSPSSVYHQHPHQPTHLHWVTVFTCNPVSSLLSPLTTTASTNPPPLGHCVHLQSSTIPSISLPLPTSPATTAAMTHHRVHLQSGIITIISLLPTPLTTASTDQHPQQLHQPTHHHVHLQSSIISIISLLPASPPSCGSAAKTLKRCWTLSRPAAFSFRQHDQRVLGHRSVPQM